MRSIRADLRRNLIRYGLIVRDELTSLMNGGSIPLGGFIDPRADCEEVGGWIKILAVHQQTEVIRYSTCTLYTLRFYIKRARERLHYFESQGHVSDDQDIYDDVGDLLTLVQKTNMQIEEMVGSWRSDVKYNNEIEGKEDALNWLRIIIDNLQDEIARHSSEAN